MCSGDSVARHRRLCKSTGKLSKEEIQRSVPAFPRFLNPPPKDQNQQAQNAQQDISEVLWPKSEKLLRFSRAIVWQVYQKDSQQVFQQQLGVLQDRPEPAVWNKEWKDKLDAKEKEMKDVKDAIMADIRDKAADVAQEQGYDMIFANYEGIGTATDVTDDIIAKLA